MSKLYSLPYAISALGLASVTATGVGGAIDTQAYDGNIGFVQVAKNTAGTNPTLDTKVTHCDTSGGTYTDVSGGAFTQVTDAGTLAQVTQKIEIQRNALKRYVKISKTIGGTSSPAFLHEVLLVGHKKNDV